MKALEKSQISSELAKKVAEQPSWCSHNSQLIQSLKILGNLCCYYQLVAGKDPLGSFREMVISTCCWVGSARKYILVGNFNNSTGVKFFKFGFTEHTFLRSLHKQSIICILNNIGSFLYIN